jgi:hypothetical protein
VTAFPVKSHWTAWTCAALLAIHAILLAWTAAVNSATYDEPGHLAAGCVYWKQGNFTVYALSPPLLRLWAAIPAVVAGVNTPDSHQFDDLPLTARHLNYLDPFVYANASRLPMLIFICRLWMIPLSLLAGWIIYRWAGQLYGATSGVIACALYCFNPTLLANGSLITTDIGTATAMLAAAWAWWHFCRQPNLKRLSLVCLAMLAAHLCKFTVFMIWPMTALMAVPFVFIDPRRWRALVGGWVAAGLMTVLLLDVVYGFRGVTTPIGSQPFLSAALMKWQHRLPAHLPSILPSLYLCGFDAQKHDTQMGYPAYLFSEIYQGSRWYYYPDALMLKTQVSVLVLLALAVISVPITARKRTRERNILESSLALGGIVYVAGVLVGSDVNIGTRYMVPAFGFAFIFISRLWLFPWEEFAPWRVLRTALVVTAAVESLAVSPDYLTYINFLFGGPEQGWKLVTNADYDWGQGLIALRHWMEDHQVKSVKLFYFGFIDPEIYGVHYTSGLTTSQPGDYYAVSAFYMCGLPNRLMTSPGKRQVFYFPHPFIAALRAHTPVAVVGNTIFIFTADDMTQAQIESNVH